MCIHFTVKAFIDENLLSGPILAGQENWAVSAKFKTTSQEEIKSEAFSHLLW